MTTNFDMHAIQPRQLWMNRDTGVPAKIVSYLERQDQVVLMISNGGGAEKLDIATFRGAYQYVPPHKRSLTNPRFPKAKPPASARVTKKLTGRKKSPETDLVKSILARLEQMPGVAAWRNNTGVFKAPATATTRRKFVRFGAPGSGDIFVVVAPLGRFLSVEAKAPKGTERTSQKLWRQKMRRMGAASIVVRSVDEVVAAIVAMQNDKM
jgi:hypothetical protein